MNDLSFFQGRSAPLGAQLGPDGVNFSVFSRNAKEIVLHLFETVEDSEPIISYKLDPQINKTGDVWHVFVAGLKTWAFYLYTADGDFLPSAGRLFDPNNYLLDPYARLISAHSIFNSEQIFNQIKRKEPGGKNQYKRTATGFPKCVVVDEREFDWQGDRPLNISLQKCVIYEAHVKGFSFLNDKISPSKRGKYSGLVELIPYLTDLGITSLELLPVFEFDENENMNVNPKTGLRLKNYWGYSTIAFFAPKALYAEDPGNAVNEFKFMVREFHKAGIEIILDVVFNHTAEGNEHGPIFSFKGFDNSIYYHLEDNKLYYKNFSGCGNSIKTSETPVIKFILDCLRYWVSEMHVDGFRFDLAPVLARDKAGNIDLNSFMIQAIADDPVLHSTKIIAEPWDAGGAYMVGKFPGRWAEWNDLFRNSVRQFWLQPNPDIRHLASRITGSSDLYSQNGRRPYQSINFVCCHDGFTLWDLLSYSEKHNEENGENNRDGSNENLSYNHGIEGRASNEVELMRMRSAKNILTSLILSVGTPMLNMGDEVFRTQNGNNNTYCQDNEMSWFDWELVEENKDFFEFTKKLINLRKTHFSFLRKSFFSGVSKITGAPIDIAWFDHQAQKPNWNSSSNFLAFLIDGNKINLESDENDNDFYFMANSYNNDITVKLPPPSSGGKVWHRLIDTSYTGGKDFLDEENTEQIMNQQVYVVLARTIVVLISK
ncbi:glycogen debranching protein GlgX [Treponema sp. OMZ 787]|uniref:glycogen debranching protein GlgX n=1 Tax=Treponema sp. OMZ 787 TaxID=2563669 RepID=UPI0020A2BA4B|nr:glycogen debranching protein GlgX [Treponema sp. OMZ 787]UTC62761.1 glycogen debranching protein GlgX [Treponema sp. OMZ 787]